MRAFRVKYANGSYGTLWADCEAELLGMPDVAAVWVLGGE
jgi:hypothetical protein